MFTPDTVTEGMYLNLCVTHECTNDCAFCIDDYRGKHGFVSITAVRDALTVAQGIGIHEVLVTGGEPTLHPAIIQICQMCKSQGFTVTMTTNNVKPETLLECASTVDNINLSDYGNNVTDHAQVAELTTLCDVTISKLIHKSALNTVNLLNEYIAYWQCQPYNVHNKFKTLCVPVVADRPFIADNQIVSYLDDLPGKRVILFNELVGQYYRDCLIARYDLIVNKQAAQSLKLHPNGKIDDSWLE